MKKFLFLLTIAFAAMSMSAAPVDQATAQKKAKDYLAQAYAGKIMSPNALNPVLVKTEMCNGKSTPAFYVYNTSTTFVVVAADDRAETILMVGDKPLRDVENLPLGLQDMFTVYKGEITYLAEHPDLKVVANVKNNSLNAVTYGPLLTCNWDQDAPYWNECTFSGYQCYTGCPATSAAMVFYYWKYPTDPAPALPGYASSIDVSYWNSISYTHPAMPSVTFDWDNMLDTYTGSYTNAQGAAVAALMHYIGHAEHMAYGTQSAGGSGVHVDSVGNILNAFLICGYDPETTHFVKKTSAYSGGTTLYSDAEWAAMIQEEMAAERPIVFCAVGDGGHAFNVDGYRSNDSKYHINLGWSGDGNGWCVLNSFGGGGSVFNTYQQMVLGIQPPAQGPSIKVNTTTLNMEAFVGKTSTATFTVKGNELTSNITLSLNDPNGVFALDATSVAVSDQENGKVITVTYAPTVSGNHTATITLSNPDAEDKVVTLNGVATLETYVPEMQPANENYINLTKFRADWTDQTDPANVDNYTLEVSTRPAIELLDSLDGRPYTGSYSSITLTSPWGGSSVYRGNGAYYFSSGGSITFTIPEGYTNESFSMQITTSTHSSYGSGNLTVRSTQTGAVGHSFSPDETYTWVVTGSTGDKITITTTDYSYSPDMALIKVYAGDITNASFKANEEGDATYRLITGITDKNYTVNNLEAAGTFYYRVKALYIDGTQSAWSNSQKVTLFENGDGYTLGDVNHDQSVDINDVTALIAYVLGQGNTICTDCADVFDDDAIDINDVTALINMVLGMH